MNEKIFKKLKKLKRYNFIKLEYCCEDCGNIVYRTLEKPEIAHLIDNIRDFEPLLCSVCGEENLIINDITTEKQFYKNNPDFLSGG